MVAISETLQQEGKYNNCFHFFAGAIMTLRSFDCQCQSRNSPELEFLKSLWGLGTEEE